MSDLLEFELDEKGIYGAAGTYYVSGSTENISGDIVIPPFYNGKPVTGIGGEVFKEKKLLTGVKMPDSITWIGWDAFDECTALKSVSLSKNLDEFSQTFRGCSALTEIILPEGLKLIAEDAFAGCESLENIIIPVGIESIGSYAFSNCSRLKKIIIPDGIEGIGEGAFFKCIALESISLPGNMQLGADVFKTCINLTINFRAFSEELEKDNDYWNPDKRPVNWNCAE